MATVMIVEDSMIMRHSIKRILIELGHKVISEAANGFESIEKYKLMKPDIVTMDITMPGENGIENGIDALVEIKKINKDANVIMLTSHGEQKLVMQAVSKGAKGYILKPVTKEKIARCFWKNHFKNIMKDTDIEHTILDCLTKVSQSFLNDDMKIEVIDTNSIEKYDIINYYLGTVKFTKEDTTIICVVSMDKPLFDTIFKVFFPEEISQEEYDELALALPDEIINTVAGLSISEFPKEYEDLEMSVPLSFKKSALKILKQNGRFISKEIKTTKGSFVCTVI